MNAVRLKSAGISDAARLAKRYEAAGCIVLFPLRTGKLVGASWGVDKNWCRWLGAGLDRIADAPATFSDSETHSAPVRP